MKMNESLFLKGFCWALLLMGVGLLSACGYRQTMGFTEEECSIIHAAAPEGRTDYEGQIMRLWKISNTSDSLLLRSEAQPVTKEMLASSDYAVLRERMLVTVRDSLDEGVGIAAPQVGISRQMIAVQRFDQPGEPFEFYLNPEILSMGEEQLAGMEGCLSVPHPIGHLYGSVPRAQKLVLRYRTEDFRDTTETILGFTAVIFQHEVDHLKGKLFIDRMIPGSEVLQ